MEDVKQLKVLDDPTSSLPFTGEILSSLRQEITSDTALLGFIGAPWTLAAYTVEGKADRHCLHTKVHNVHHAGVHFTTRFVALLAGVTVLSDLVPWQRQSTLHLRHTS
jgi:uroporphyrinogen decarboxylase